MITQNPIIGRSRKKMGNVYARTMWGKNIIQTCPTNRRPSKSKALHASYDAFRVVTRLANQVPATLLSNIYYAAPVGRSRRHVLTSQLFTGVLRDNDQISFDVNAISQLGTNPVTTTAGLVHTIPGASFTLPVSAFPATELADTSRAPLVFAISYRLLNCTALLSNVTVEDNELHFVNISETLHGQPVLLIALWQTNIGSSQTPNWVFGGFLAETP